MIPINYELWDRTRYLTKVHRDTHTVSPCTQSLYWSLTNCNTKGQSLVSIPSQIVCGDRRLGAKVLDKDCPKRYVFPFLLCPSSVHYGCVETGPSWEPHPQKICSSELCLVLKGSLRKKFFKINNGENLSLPGRSKNVTLVPRLHTQWLSTVNFIIKFSFSEILMSRVSKTWPSCV